jgi:hypothetical protein
MIFAPSPTGGAGKFTTLCFHAFDDRLQLVDSHVWIAGLQSFA